MESTVLWYKAISAGAVEELALAPFSSATVS